MLDKIEKKVRKLMMMINIMSKKTYTIISIEEFLHSV